MTRGPYSHSVGWDRKGHVRGASIAIAGLWFPILATFMRPSPYSWRPSTFTKKILVYSYLKSSHDGSLGLRFEIKFIPRYISIMGDVMFHAYVISRLYFVGDRELFMNL